MIQGDIDTSFQTMQRDMFASGLAAEIGMNAMGVWQAIKAHADYTTGECWPGVRRLGEMTGLSIGMVSKCVQTLTTAKLLRVTRQGKGKAASHYIARERMVVRLGSRILCTIVVDYVPNSMRERLKRIREGLAGAESNADLWADCEIIPGLGFTWDETSGSLRAQIPARGIPAVSNQDDQVLNYLQQKVKRLAKAAHPVDKST